MKLQLIFAWYDLWVGFFWDSKKRWLYFFPIPMCGVILKFVKGQPKCNHVWIKDNLNIKHCVKCHEQDYTDSKYKPQ